MVLLAIVDASRRFIYVDIGAYDKEGDSGVFTKWSLFKRIHQGEYFSDVAKQSYPYVNVGDEAFRIEPIRCDHIHEVRHGTMIKKQFLTTVYHGPEEHRKTVSALLTFKSNISCFLYFYSVKTINCWSFSTIGLWSS